MRPGARTSCSFETIDYPKDTRSPRYWLDFIHWYQDGFTEMMGKIAAHGTETFSQNSHQSSILAGLMKR